MSGPEQREAPGVIALMLRWFTWRHWRRHWRSTLLLVGIISLGVGVFLSVRLANRAAISGFGLFTESIAGESDFVVRPRSGPTIEIATLRELREELGDLPVVLFPVIEATVAGPVDGEGAAVARQVIGVDLVALRNAVNLGAGEAPGSLDGGEGEDSGSSFHLGSADQAFFAARGRPDGGSVGDRVEVVINDRVVELEVAGWIEDDPLRPSVPENLVLMDLPGAQALLGWEGRASRVELVVPPGRGADSVRGEVNRRLKTASEGRPWLLEDQRERGESIGKMTHAFRMNLTVLSTLALLVGTYLVLQALEAAVVRRREEIAILRSLGLTERAIKRLWMAESLGLGILGSALGVLVGWGGAQLTVGAIARTVNGLYYSTTTEAASLHLGEAMAAFAFGVLASLVAGWLPARDAASTPPAQSLRSGVRAEGIRLLKRPWVGMAAAGSALVLGTLPPWERGNGVVVPVGGYLAALGWLIALSILAGLLFPVVRKILTRLLGRIPEASYAASQFRRPLGRHRLAVAGLVAAIGMAAGMGVLVHSFEGTLTGWIGQLLKADLYVATAGAEQASNASVIREKTWRDLQGDGSLEGIDVIRRYQVDLEGNRVRLAGAEYFSSKDRELGLTWLAPPDDPRPSSLEAPLNGAVTPAWVNEAFARRFEVAPGDRFSLPTPAGPETFEVGGVYADYSDEFGTVLVNRRFTAAWFQDESVSNVAAYLAPGEDPDEVEARWEKRFPGLQVRQNGRLRGEALRVFHQTFAVTYALEAIGVFVAVAGLGLALASLMIERGDQLVTLKSIGFTRAQVARASALEGAALGGIGFSGGAVLSLLLGALLIFVINRQSFGWTLDYRVPWGLLVGLGILTLATSALVAAAVGYRSARVKGDDGEEAR